MTNSPFKFTEDWILEQLSSAFPPETFAFFPKLRIGTGYGPDSQQEFDGWSIHYLKGKRNYTTCFEVKCSRADFFLEIRKPQKRRAGLRLSNHFYFVTPKGLIKQEECPAECGLLEFDENGKLETVIPAPFREAFPTWQFLASIAKRKDKDRAEVETAKEKWNLREAHIRMHSIRVIKDRIERLRNFNGGSKEIPDKVANELEGVLSDILSDVQTDLDLGV